MAQRQRYPIRFKLRHRLAHKDEWIADLLASATVSGQTLLPGADSAEWLDCDAGSAKFHGLDGIQCLERGILPLGILENNPFNEHAIGGQSRKKNDCTTTLMCKYLGLWEANPAWRTVCRAVLNDDAFGQKTPFDTSILVDADQYFDTSPAALRQYGAEFQTAALKLYKRELAVLRAGRRHYASVSWTERDHPELRRPIRFGSIVCDDQLLYRYVSYYEDETYQPDLFFQWQTSGHVQVHTKKGPLDISQVARAIRVAEASKLGIHLTDDASLVAEGNHPLVPNWGYLMGENRMKKLFNGGPRSPGFAPTRIRPEELMAIAWQNLRLEPPREDRYQKRRAA